MRCGLFSRHTQDTISHCCVEGRTPRTGWCSWHTLFQSQKQTAGGRGHLCTVYRIPCGIAPRPGVQVLVPPWQCVLGRARCPCPCPCPKITIDAAGARGTYLAYRPATCDSSLARAPHWTGGCGMLAGYGIGIKLCRLQSHAANQPTSQVGFHRLGPRLGTSGPSTLRVMQLTGSLDLSSPGAPCQ